jgi:hypothetical protein
VNRAARLRSNLYGTTKEAGFAAHEKDSHAPAESQNESQA